MAPRGSSKWFSLAQERRIAERYGAIRSLSSGASVVSKGDARQSKGTRYQLTDQMFECKHTGTFESPKRSIRITLDHLEKLLDEAYAESREPVLCLSLYAPDSPASDAGGFVDLTVRLTKDDAQRERLLEHVG